MRQIRASEILPCDHNDALLVGRIWARSQRGPCVVLISGGAVYDLSSLSPTMSGLLEIPDISCCLSNLNDFPQLGRLDDFCLLGNAGSAGELLAPCDLQALKAAGVTFAGSMLERVIEEHVKGDPERAATIRAELTPILGNKLSGLVPGSREALSVKAFLQNRGLWSQYLEVGIGPDAEIFTKAQPMSSLGTGTRIGIHRSSTWNNPEPEVVLAVNSSGRIVGATLGNDVNLRDFEGRSALLLGKAKDNNGSCVIGPFIRLFDSNFSLSDVETLSVSLTIAGLDGFQLSEQSDMKAISRSPTDLVKHAMGPFHQYPDGMMLFLGTMFSPIQDRRQPGQGFTHEVGDEVRIETPLLGILINWVGYSDEIAPWTYGARALMENLASRGLLSKARALLPMSND